MNHRGPGLPPAVLWDFDGTLVDTEPFWFEAEGDLVREHGGEWGQAQAEALIGSNLPNTARVLREAGVDLGEEEILDHLMTIRRTAPRPRGAVA